jgi:hypothetical protein
MALSQSLKYFLQIHQNLRIYLCKIGTVIAETLIVKTSLKAIGERVKNEREMHSWTKHYRKNYKVSKLQNGYLCFHFDKHFSQFITVTVVQNIVKHFSVHRSRRVVQDTNVFLKNTE